MGVDAMRRITISIDDELLATLERLGARRGYANRSETLRDMIREAIGRERSEHEERAPCLATLTYVYEKRDLGRRLTQVRGCGATITFCSTIVLNRPDPLTTAPHNGYCMDVPSIRWISGGEGFWSPSRVCWCSRAAHG